MNASTNGAPVASTRALTIAALGVVYGDIGTSPLYAVKESFSPANGVAVSPDNVLGILSLIFWLLIVVVTVKYVALLMRADNRGEGGVLALMALVSQRLPGGARGRRLILFLGIAGAALFFGDCILTPAVSVFGAIEGLTVATDIFDDAIVPLTLLALTILFLVQRFGTGKVGGLFGPITFLWFVALIALGAVEIAANPVVLQAVNPVHAVRFGLAHGWHTLIALGAVVLAITGAEALYADMGHFGRRPIRLAWLGLVLPALVINYFGQGAVILRDPSAIDNPFYRMVPEWGLYPMVALATMAAIIASQAVISGAFSMAQQASLLGLMPRVAVRHTSASAFGQIYVPSVNWLLLAGVAVLVVEFKSSSALASAYGIAVTGTMLITTVLAIVLARSVWRWSLAKVALLAGLLALDAVLFGANTLKILHGGWIPLLLGAILFLAMWTWLRGRELVASHERAGALPVDLFLNRIEPGKLYRAPGTAVFLTALHHEVPRNLLHNLKHNNVLHERVLIVSVQVLDQPHVAAAERIETLSLGKGLYRVTLNYGFMQSPHVPRDLARLAERGLPWDAMRTSYFIGHSRFVPGANSALPRWQEKLFLGLTRIASNAPDFFQLPSNQVVELGSRIEV